VHDERPDGHRVVVIGSGFGGLFATKKLDHTLEVATAKVEADRLSDRIEEHVEEQVRRVPQSVP